MKTVKFLQDYVSKSKDLANYEAGETLELDDRRANALHLQKIAVIIDPTTGEPYPEPEPKKVKENPVKEPAVEIDLQNAKEAAETVKKYIDNKVSDLEEENSKLRQDLDKLWNVVNSLVEAINTGTGEENKAEDMETNPGETNPETQENEPKDSVDVENTEKEEKGKHNTKEDKNPLKTKGHQ